MLVICNIVSAGSTLIAFLPSTFTALPVFGPVQKYNVGVRIQTIRLRLVRGLSKTQSQITPTFIFTNVYLLLVDNLIYLIYFQTNQTLVS